MNDLLIELLIKAHDLGASSIVIEPDSEESWIRFRVDGGRDCDCERFVGADSISARVKRKRYESKPNRSNKMNCQILGRNGFDPYGEN